MKAIVTADLHLTDRRHDLYRWGIFAKLVGLAKRKKIRHVIIAGDLTDEKDRHSARFVDQLQQSVVALAGHADVWILKGNHDYTDEPTPFFKWLDHIDGVHYINEPRYEEIDGTSVLFLPHTRDIAGEWKALRSNPPAALTVIHQPCIGAALGGGRKLADGLGPRDYFTDDQVVVAGDIHKPQRLGPVRYVGSPYPINFGEDYEHRVFVYNAGKLKTVRTTSIAKTVLRIREVADLDEYDLAPGDQVRVIVNLPRADFPDWQQIRQEIMDALSDQVVRGIELQARPTRKKLKKSDAPIKTATPADALRSYFESHSMSRTMMECGIAIVEDLP